MCSPTCPGVHAWLERFGVWRRGHDVLPVSSMAPGWGGAVKLDPGGIRAGVGLRAVLDTPWRASGRLVDTRGVVARYAVMRQG